MRVIGKYMYIGEDYGISLIKGKCYYRIELNNEFRIVDETDEDYLYPSIYFEEIEIDLYENDAEVLPILEKNLNSAKDKCKKLTKYNIINENFITYNKNRKQEKYDIIISNPPYS